MDRVALPDRRCFWLGLFCLLAGCHAEPPAKVFNAAEITVTDEAREIAARSNESAFDLYGRLRRNEGNLFFSPASVSTALAMAYAGAGGETKKQMAKVLHLDASDEQVHRGFGELAQILNSDGDRYQLRMASRLWGLEGYPFRREFLTLMRQRYGSELAQVNFNRPAAAAHTINTWIGKQTEGKIGELVSPDMIGPPTRLMLTNAIYFKAAWQNEFWKGATGDAPFYVSAEDEADVPMMRQLEYLPYAETDDAQVLELPYVGGDLSMVVLLPKQTYGLADWEQTIAPGLDQWLADFESRRVDVYLPKFQIASRLPLTEALKSLGMTLAFNNDEADLSGMTAAEQLWLAAVVHAAFVDVDEEGTEAAAATAAKMDAAAVPPNEDQPVVFRADHAFLFLIRDRRTGAILFLGRLVNPTAKTR